MPTTTSEVSASAKARQRPGLQPGAASARQHVRDHVVDRPSEREREVVRADEDHVEPGHGEDLVQRLDRRDGLDLDRDGDLARQSPARSSP